MKKVEFSPLLTLPNIPSHRVSLHIRVLGNIRETLTPVPWTADYTNYMHLWKERP